MLVIKGSFLCFIANTEVQFFFSIANVDRYGAFWKLPTKTIQLGKENIEFCLTVNLIDLALRDNSLQLQCYQVGT